MGLSIARCLTTHEMIPVGRLWAEAVGGGVFGWVEIVSGGRMSARGVARDNLLSVRV